MTGLDFGLVVEDDDETDEEVNRTDVDGGEETESVDEAVGATEEGSFAGDELGDLRSE